MNPTLYFGLAVLVTIPLTAIVCRYRIAHKKPVSFRVLLVSAFGAAICSFAFACGPLVFIRHFVEIVCDLWVLFVIPFATLLCLFAAGGVRAFYQARSKQ
jgi:ABC-type polysaccharide/polyol phosphate export permease